MSQDQDTDYLVTLTRDLGAMDMADAMTRVQTTLRASLNDEGPFVLLNKTDVAVLLLGVIAMGSRIPRR